MKSVASSAVSVFAGASSLLLACDAAGRDICWIESVTKKSGGVEIRLFQGARAMLKTPGKPAQFMNVDSTPPMQQSIGADLKLVPYIAAKLGDKIDLAGRIHATCTLFVATTADQIGVFASAQQQTLGGVLPDGTPLVSTATKFIRAQ